MSQVRSSRVSRAVGSVAVAIFALTCGAAVAAPAAPDGIWYTKDDESIIKVAPCADVTEAYCGTLIWLKEPTEKDGSPKRDTLNKDPAKKDRPLVGLKILIDMKAEDDHWSGKAYNPEDGKKYSITFKVKEEENDKAALRGCILGFLCQTETFTRAKEVPGGEPNLADAGHHKKHKKKDVESE